jgi:transposase
MSKLTEEQRTAIKASDKSATALAKEYGVSIPTITKLRGVGAPAVPRPGTPPEISLEDDWVLIRVPRKALTKKLLAHLV